MDNFLHHFHVLAQKQAIVTTSSGLFLRFSCFLQILAVTLHQTKEHSAVRN
jgi:hypothetical protein